VQIAVWVCYAPTFKLFELIAINEQDIFTKADASRLACEPRGCDVDTAISPMVDGDHSDEWLHLLRWHIGARLVSLALDSDWAAGPVATPDINTSVIRAAYSANRVKTKHRQEFDRGFLELAPVKLLSQPFASNCTTNPATRAAAFVPGWGGFDPLTTVVSEQSEMSSPRGPSTKIQNRQVLHSR
jgi:hypothetical protein